MWDHIINNLPWDMAIYSECSTTPAMLSLHPLVAYLSFVSSRILFLNCLGSHYTYASAFLLVPDLLGEHPGTLDFQMLLPPHSLTPPLKSQRLHLKHKQYTGFEKVLYCIEWTSEACIHGTWIIQNK